MSSKDVAIREMARTDVAAVAAIEKECAVSPWSHDLFMGEFSLPAESRHWLVAESKDTIVGFAGAMFAADESTILNVGVPLPWRRRGIAQQMLRDLFRVSATRGIKQAFLEVRASNEEARSLYLKLGFVEVGQRKKYYSDGENAIVMRRITRDFLR